MRILAPGVAATGARADAATWLKAIPEPGIKQIAFL
jgi:hypothetical protein